jgi:hypothetical protein
MAPRQQLQDLLVSLLGSSNVYYQPPSSGQIQYPCIIYERDSVDTKHADNKPYSRRKRYKVTVIDANPDSTIPDAIGELPLCSFDRHYKADQLNHDVFNIFF